MSKRLEKWNRSLAKGLWWIVLLGVIGSAPVLAARVQTEHSADTVEVMMDYRDLLQVSSTQGAPQQFVQEQLARLKDAGVNAMVVFESTLEELAWAGEATVYDARQAALLEGRVDDPAENATYVLFNRPESEPELRPIVETAFAKAGVAVQSWTLKGRPGLKIAMGRDDAVLRPMQPNPVAMRELKEAGFRIVPRLSDRIRPYDEAEMEKWLQTFDEVGVTRIVFDGDAVTGFGDRDEPGVNSLDRFAEQLKAHGIGIGMFENLRVPQAGLMGLAQRLDYNVVRAHPISEAEMTLVKPGQLEDRLLLAVKDRNIRMIYLNAVSVRDALKWKVTHPFDTIVQALQGDEELGSEGAVKRWADFGFTVGEAQPFDVHRAPAEKVWRALATLGAAALVALTIGLFAPALLTPVAALGAIGSAGVIVLDAGLLNQALALFVGIASPTAAMVLLIRRLRERRVRQAPPGRRMVEALGLYAGTAVLSLASVPLIIALLNHISYSLVLQQFRGVSLLHLAPIGLALLYVLVYGPGGSVWSHARRLLATPVTVLMIVALAVLGAAGLYYLTRTGNSGTATSLELALRTMLEETFGVRPRFKEFVLGHPLFLVSLFLSLRYRWALVPLGLSTIGQLSMVDTFAHIHTPAVLSLIRVLLGLGLGAIIGLIGIGVWQAAEAVWNRYVRQTVMER